MQDRDGAKGLLLRSRRLYSFVERVFADGGYAGKLETSGNLSRVANFVTR